MNFYGKDIVILDGARTPLAHYGGSLKDVHPTDMSVHVAKEAMKRSNVEPDWIDHVVWGNASQSSGDAQYLARHICLKAGCPITVPALNVGRICGSGLEAIVTAARMLVVDDEYDFILAGGVETMDQMPFVIRNARDGLRYGKGVIEHWVDLNFIDTYNGLRMALTAENLVEKYKIPREEQDEFAYRSHMLAKAARDSGRLAKEIIPIEVPAGRRGETKLFGVDERIRDDTTVEKLSKLRPAFKKDGTVTAGNACPITDGAASVVVTTMEKAKERGLKPLARLVSYGAMGCDPDIMGIGPVPATKQALQRAGLKLEDIDIIELNEAFAAQYLACERELGNDRDSTNVNGGAIALGHPTACTGVRISLTAMYELRERSEQYGLATMCIGGGQGMAGIFENVT
ncbi:MAG: beta-ketoadipyl CoA thiolase [Chloroflexi bacterium B3_Chlor]|nr:MAG: beta-ketoadipyl CoA thiolase [Chloroflexi bacterium B3_Chlor]